MAGDPIADRRRGSSARQSRPDLRGMPMPAPWRDACFFEPAMPTPSDFPIGTAYLLPLADGRATLCRVVNHGSSGRHVIVAGSTWIGDPADVTDALLARPEARAILQVTHHGQRGRPCLYSIDQSVLNDRPRATRAVGTIEPTDAERRLDCTRSWRKVPLARRVSPGAWGQVALDRLGQWEWDQDSAAVRARERAERRRIEKQRRQQCEQASARPASPGPVRATAPRTTLASLARQPLFASWRPDRSPEQVNQSRALVRASIARLQARARARVPDLAEIRRCARGFNRLDARLGHFVTTIEAEQIHAVLCSMGMACGLGVDQVADAIDAVRDW
jgi:hypothetical protein